MTDEETIEAAKAHARAQMDRAETNAALAEAAERCRAALEGEP